MRKKAFFVNRPRRLDDLKRLHLVNEEEPFEIVRNVTLRESSPNLCVNCFRHNMQEAA